MQVGAVKDADGQLLSGLLYDWHNSLRLEEQNEDIRFWREVLYDSTSVLVLGAGTGRIATPLSRPGRLVLAVDSDIGRLDRIETSSSLTALGADLEALPFTAIEHDDVVVPYSTLQLLDRGASGRVLATLARLMSSRCRLWVDISISFIGRQNSEWATVLDDWCEDLGERVIERHRVQNEGGVCQIEIEFCRRDGSKIMQTTERWFHHPVDDLLRVIRTTGLDVCHISVGYGGGRSLHRRVFQLRRSSEAN